MLSSKAIKEYVFFIGIVILGVLTRTLWHIGPNVEFITGLSLFSGYFFSFKSLKYLTPISIMIISDLFIGNSSIFVYTWTGFLLVPLIGELVKLANFKREIVGMEMGAFIGIIWFYLWTNLGVVFTTQMYSRNFGGILESYINGLPFLVNQLLGNLLIIPIIFSIGKFVWNIKFNFKKINQILLLPR